MQKTYKGFTLDTFQIEAIQSLEKNNSVIVSAATGTGKTLIADYVIDKAMQEGKKVFYTAPIKALSNQKFKDFTSDYGEDAVGIMTGDIVVNPQAQIVVMTTEIYRNMLMVNDPMVNEISYIIFDEIHFINDIDRGVVWEESIIFSPEHVRFLALSATIPNADEFAGWIRSIKNHTVDVVKWDKRAVPLTHYVFERMLGMTKPEEVVRHAKKTENVPKYEKVKGKKKKKRRLEPATHMDLAHEIRHDGTPTIFFTFSRKACEIKGRELAKELDLTTKKEKERIISIVNSMIQEELKQMISTKRLRQVLPRGIAFHHAGMLPNLKEIVEVLFGEGLIKFLYATETFAVGINMPAKTVCFNSLQKYDGISFRYLNTKEYFQMAGRAGRRGIDTEGTAVAIVDRQYDDLEKINNLMSGDTEPIKSQFHLSYNSVLNLLHTYSDEEIRKILKSNFHYYLKKQAQGQVKIMTSWKHKLKTLRKLGFIDQDGLTQKGWFTRYIYTNELIIGDIFATDIQETLTVKEICLIGLAVTYEGKRGTRFYAKNTGGKLAQSVYDKLKHDKFLARKINPKVLNNLAPFVETWSEDTTFADLMPLSNLAEGDIVRLFRQGIDVLRQVKKGTNDKGLFDKVTRAIELLDRDVIQVQF